MALNTVKEFKAGRPVDLGADNSGSIISSCAFVRQFSNSFYQRFCLCFIFSLYQHALESGSRHKSFFKAKSFKDFCGCARKYDSPVNDWKYSIESTPK